MAVLIGTGFSCADEALDPLQFERVKKGTLLALRGGQLDAVYFDGAPYGARFFPNNLTGEETFEYDAEFLSADGASLESVEIYVLKRTKSGSTITTSRVLLTTIEGSSFQTTDDYRGPWTSVSLELSDILTALGVSLNSEAAVEDFFDLYGELGVQMESDLNLKDGSQVLASSLVASGLVESDQFYPAQKLTYGVEDIEDSRPVATLSQRGQFSIVSGKVVRTIVPLKSGVKDTLDIVFDQSIATPPTVSIVPASAGTIGALVAVAGKDNSFYVPFVAGANYTGNVVFNVTGATSAEEGALNGLGQSSSTSGISGIAMDNLPPQNTSFTTGTRLGKGQSATITLRFNEALGTAPTITIDPVTTGIDGVTDVKATLSADGLTATYTYEYKDLNGDATHGNAVVSVAGGKDLAGNDLGAIADKTLTVDIGAAPAPIITLDGAQFDWGTQVKWVVTYATGASNPGGSTTGTIYYVAQTSGKPAPTGFVGGDVPQFIMAEDPDSDETPKEMVSARQTGTIPITSSSPGTTGSVYAPFTPNGTLDVYAVFVSSTGVISAISAPVTVTME